MITVIEFKLSLWKEIDNMQCVVIIILQNEIILNKPYAQFKQSEICLLCTRFFDVYNLFRC